jgi:hypothetical protein
MLLPEASTTMPVGLTNIAGCGIPVVNDIVLVLESKVVTTPEGLFFE